MTEAEKLLCEHMADFIELNFDKVNYDLKDTGLPETKNKFKKLVSTSIDDAMWALMEWVHWGISKNELKKIFLEGEDDEFRIIKVKDKYLKITTDEDFNETVSFSERKTKTKIIEYFE